MTSFSQKIQYIESRIIKLPIINQNNEEDQLILLTNLSQKNLMHTKSQIYTGKDGKSK